MTRKSALFVVVTLAGLVLPSVASAQNSKFEGFYLGGYLSYSDVRADVSLSGVGSVDESGDGFGGGALIGFGGTNWDGRLYGAIELDVGYDGAQYDESATVAGLGTASLDVETQLTFGVSGRIGTVIADDFLLYGKIGYVRTNAEAELEGNVVGIGPFSVSDDEWFDGFRFGAGLEGMVANNISIRAEYTYTIYDDPDIAPGLSIDPDQHLVRIGASYYF